MFGYDFVTLFNFKIKRGRVEGGKEHTERTQTGMESE